MNRWWIVLFFMVCCGIAAYGYVSPSIQFPEYSADMRKSPRLQMLKDMFFEAKTQDQQELVFGYILSSQEPSKDDLLMDIALRDLKGAGLYGKSSTMGASIRELAVSNVGLTAKERYLYGYAYLLKFDTGIQVRRLAAQAMGKIHKKETATLITYLLHFLYNPRPFIPDNPKMDMEDRVAEELVRALGEIGNPAGLPILLQIVNMQNHRYDTVEAAWVSLSKMRIKSEAYRYFILSLRDTLQQRSEQVSPAQQAQVDKTVQTLVKFIRDNFERYHFNEDDVETVKGTLVEEGGR